jgi:FkbM family methyltransferase
MLAKSGNSVPQFILDISKRNNRRFYFFTRQLYRASHNSNLGWLLESLLKTGDTFIDIGANVGIYSFMAARIVGSSGQVFSFEPDPMTYRGLSESAELNAFSQVRCLNIALSNYFGEASFYVDSGDSVGSSLLSTFDYNEVTKVKVDTFDNVIGTLDSDPQKVRLIKVDVEGAEYLTIQGMKGFLGFGHRPAIFCEVRGSASKRSPNTYDAVRRFLEAFGYTPFQRRNDVIEPVKAHDQIGAKKDVEDVLFLSGRDQIL